MDLHKPRPWHGFREFLKEYLIIVVGVLTALAAEQGVEWLHWRHEARVAEAALRAELHANGIAALRVVASWPCAERRLDQLSQELRTSKGAWKGHGFRLEGRKAVVVTPNQPWFWSAWDEYKSNGAVQHMPDDRRAMFNSLYVYVAGERDWGAEMGQGGAELAVLADDLSLSEVTRDRALAAIEKVRFAEYFADRAGRNFIQKLRAAGITFTDAETHPKINACNPQYGYPGPGTPPTAVTRQSGG
jgi:hypothetical protein